MCVVLGQSRQLFLQDDNDCGAIALSVARTFVPTMEPFEVLGCSEQPYVILPLAHNPSVKPSMDSH